MPPPAGAHAATAVPKLCGADVELGNFVTGVDRAQGSGAEAARRLLRAMADTAGGVGDVPDGPLSAADRQDWGRIHLPGNGGCVYVDLDHLELCLPEVRSAHDHVAAWHAMLRLAQDGLARANAGRRPERRVRALVNNRDGHGNSYGGHLNVLMARPAWEAVMERKLHHLAFLASFQASSLVLTGQGKVGSENGAPAARYQLSQRADFLETLLGPQTTFRRPLVNTRDEPLCGDPWRSPAAAGPARRLARLHVICYDSVLCEVACLLRIGTLQIVLAMLEAGAVATEAALDDPLLAVATWSRDPTLTTTADLVDGRRMGLVDHQQLLLDAALAFGAAGGLDGVVPEAAAILARWQEALDVLRRKDWDGAARRLDWALKLGLLERALRQRPDLDWEAPELRHLDHLYGSLDPAEGLFWTWARSGLVDTVVEPGAVSRLTTEPPADTRAWGRAMLLRRGGEAVTGVDWDHIRFRLSRRGSPAVRWRLDLPDPLGATRAELGLALAEPVPLESLLPALGAEPEVRRDRTRGGTGPGPGSNIITVVPGEWRRRL